MDNANQIPDPVFLLEHQAQAPPIEPRVLRVKALKVVLDGDSFGIDFSDVVDRVPRAHCRISANDVWASEVDIVDESVEIGRKREFNQLPEPSKAPQLCTVRSLKRSLVWAALKTRSSLPCVPWLTLI